MTFDLSADSISEYLGQPVLTAIVESRNACVADLRDWRTAGSAEIATSSSRGLANRIHDRFMTHMISRLDDVDGVVLRERGSTREFVVRERVIIRCKRHDGQNKIKAYATRAAVLHWGGASMIDGLEVISIAAGYRWDKELREIGPAVLSFRRGLRARPMWIVDLDRGEGLQAPVRIVPPIVPGLPAIDLFGIGAEQKQDDRG